MRTLGDLLTRNARQFADDTFIVFGERRLTHRQHMDRTKRLSAALYGAGCRHRDRVAILAMNTSEYLEMMAACWLSGFILSTVNFRLAPPEFRFLLGDTAPRVLVFEAQYTDVIAKLRPELPSIETYVCIGEAPSWAVGYEAFLASGSSEGAPADVRGEDIASIIYTSGTTGKPKGVMRSHACELANADSMATVMDVRPRGRLLVVMPYFHAGAQASSLGQLWRSGELHIHRAFEPLSVLKAVQEHRLTHVHFVPLMVQALVDLPEFDRFDLSSIETVLYAAAPMPVPVLKRALAKLGPVFVNSWGMSEGSGTHLPKYQHVTEGPGVALLGSIGYPNQLSEIRICDDDGNDQPARVPGELLLRATSMLSGYWNNTAATIESMRDGWLRTGDVGYFDEAGRIFLVDRKKDMIISGGENIYSQEVEQAVAAHPAVSGCSVIGMPDEKWGESVLALVILKPGASATEAEIIAHTATLIASYKKPKKVLFIDEFPALPSGKINKVKLRELYARPAGQ